MEELKKFNTAKFLSFALSNWIIGSLMKTASEPPSFPVRISPLLRKEFFVSKNTQSDESLNMSKSQK